jgi:hypothetical protein
MLLQGQRPQTPSGTRFALTGTKPVLSSRLRRCFGAVMLGSIAMLGRAARLCVLPYRFLLVPCVVLCAAACGNNANVGAELANTQDLQADETAALTASSATIVWTADTGQCVDVRSASTANGTPVQIYTCNQTGAQKWNLSGSTAQVLGNKCLTVAGSSPKNGSAVQISTCTSGNALQAWTVSGQQIKMKNYNLCLDLTDGNDKAGTALQVWACDSRNTNQTWTVQTSTPATPTPAPTTTPAPAASTSCKRGIAYGGNSTADLTALSKGISWWYNWSPNPEAAVKSSYAGLKLDFVPMLWNGNFNSTLLQKSLPASGYLLAFNEPNFYSQANMTPQQAAALWPQVEAVAHAHNMKIVSPALNYCGGGCNATSPFDWLDQFFAACPNCQVDYIAWHWYACTPEALSSTLKTYEQRYNRPVWLTEFSCMDNGAVTADVQQTYLKQALSILEADPMVFRYAWFTGRNSDRTDINLLGADGQLTPLGTAYVQYPQSCSR